MLGMRDSEHRTIAQKFVIVFLGLRVEARGMVGVPGLRAGRRALKRLVEASNPARSGIPAPIVIAAVRLPIAKSDESLTAFRLRRKHRVEAEQPEPIGFLEIR